MVWPLELMVVLLSQSNYIFYFFGAKNKAIFHLCCNVGMLELRTLSWIDACLLFIYIFLLI